MTVLPRRRFLVGTVVAAALPYATARAAPGLTAKIQVERTKIAVGDTISVRLSVTQSGRGSVPSPQLPDSLSQGFEIVAHQSMTRRSAAFDMGMTSSTVTASIDLEVQATKPGTYPLVFSVTDDAETVTSNRVTLVVEEATAATIATGTGKPTEARQDVFLWTSVDKTTAYVGEQIIYRLDVYDRVGRLPVELQTAPTFGDFYTYQLADQEPVIEVVAGVRYRMLTGMRRALFAQKAGQLTIGGAELSIGLRRRDRSAPIAIEILPLPAQGQPAGFSPNNVGSFTLTSQVDRNTVEVGQPFTWTVQISGQGNVPLLDPGPWPDLPGVRRYDPKPNVQTNLGDRVEGQRTWEFLLIPEKPGKLVIPARKFDYFDPEAKRYMVAKAEAIEIEVTGNEAADEAPIDATTPDQPTANLDNEPLSPVFWAEHLTRDPLPHRWLTAQRWTAAMAAIPGLAAAIFGSSALWRRFGPDEAARQRTQARMRQRQQLELARDTVESGEGFHAAVAAMLHEAAVARTGPDAVGLARPQLVALLIRRGVSHEDARRLERLLDRCDAARFAAQHGSAEERRSLLEEAAAMIKDSTLATQGAA